ncbi:probable 8-oxo-dgtp diphosphatase nudt15-like [Plasmopara halstedii]|uniref:Probable 8-oxo-dgtp diphosphatase nudt15-like n=1 Tax=Plasmopara halstedii TaxID=4781 RepID=A0A0P1AE00_PLAHL|nr:probable 8-oxo-dgtp diphosphatase nudt15-like [Plasmopara halstedii]CEG38658.1 probable 8-oxo-dgtp diphosphatase nudt15-like [Plasmopara halstedii]|eukprot:XP_024575027.1 probable 8-oxo-dgtp diphosphatase nudt15-like [Plasmopara halstedii]
MSLLPPPIPIDKAPKKKRRTLHDAENDLNACHLALLEAKRKVVLMARENAKMKVLLMRYIEKDDSLLCSSQLSVSESNSQSTQSIVQATSSASDTIVVDVVTSALSPSPQETIVAEEDNEDIFCAQPCGDGISEPVSQLSQISQASQWSELSSTSNLDAVIDFLETQDTSETNRLETLQEEYANLKEQKTHVRVGVGVLLMSRKHPNCVLIGQRKGSHGEGKFALPGGHLEMFESWKECALRELKEETDLDLKEVSFATVTNDPMEDEGKHYITIFMQATVDDDQIIRNMEPLKCEGWIWVPWADLRARNDLFTSLSNVINSEFTPAFPQP